MYRGQKDGLDGINQERAKNGNCNRALATTELDVRPTTP